MPGPADTLEVVRGMLVDVIGPEYLIGLDIELETSFDADLELESLEFVSLAERLLEHYGEQVDFVAWLATMELDDIIALTVGDLVGFIDNSTASAPSSSQAPASEPEPVVEPEIEIEVEPVVEDKAEPEDEIEVVAPWPSWAVG